MCSGTATVDICWSFISQVGESPSHPANVWASQVRFLPFVHITVVDKFCCKRLYRCVHTRVLVALCTHAVCCNCLRQRILHYSSTGIEVIINCSCFVLLFAYCFLTCSARRLLLVVSMVCLTVAVDTSLRRCRYQEHPCSSSRPTCLSTSPSVRLLQALSLFSFLRAGFDAWCAGNDLV